MEKSTETKMKKRVTVALVALAVVLTIAASQRPTGGGAAQIVERSFPEVDVVDMLDGVEIRSLSQEEVTATAGFRAMCIRTLSYIHSPAVQRGNARASAAQLNKLTQPASVLREVGASGTPEVFEALVASLERGELGPAADFVVNQCDGSGKYLNRNKREAVEHLVVEGAFAQMVSNIELPQEEGASPPELGEPTEPE